MKKTKGARGSGFGVRGKNRQTHSPQPIAHSQVADLLFEIGTEELPAAYLPGLISQLKAEAKHLFDQNHVSCQSIQTFGTPRRLVLYVKGLATLQEKPGEEVRGPSKQAAFDSSGKPTQALLGFFKSQNCPLKETKIVETPKGAYVYALQPATATETVKLLPGWLAQILGKLRSPKTMRWDASGVRFARPIRWLIARFGKSVLRVTYGNLTSGPKTRLGRPQELRSVAIPSIEGYFSTLKRAGVILNQEERQQAIERTVARAAKAFRGVIAPEMIQYGLLEEVAFLTENPQSLIGTFDKKYLELPRDVLLASMAKHQRVFAVESAGKLLPRCIAVLEGQAKKPADVRAIVERILNARLADSLLFWNNDRKRSINQMAVDASGVTFHEKIGSMAEKTKRLTGLSPVLEKSWGLSHEQAGHLKRASQLAKADLVSTMVKEFPTLQGTMGKYYAQAANDSNEVAVAIEEHYLPLAGKLPRSLVGGALAILDKYDTLSSYFSLGIMPTGDQDPFGLRRAAQGIVEVAFAIKKPLPLQALFEARAALGALGDPAQKEVLRQKIQTYILERLYTFEWPKPAPSNDCIDAVVELYRNKPCEDLTDAMRRIQMLHKLRNDASFIKAAKVIERTRNILRSAKPFEGAVQPDLLKESPEQALWDAYNKSRDRLHSLIENQSYDKATQEFGEVFYEPLHLFFDKVMVNAEDAALKRNRLALMRTIQTLYTDRVADLSKLTLLQQQQRS